MALIANNKVSGGNNAASKLKQNIAKRSGNTTKKTTSTTTKKTATSAAKKVTPSMTTRTTTDPNKKVDQSKNTLKNVVETIVGAVNKPQTPTRPLTPITDKDESKGDTPKVDPTKDNGWSDRGGSNGGSSGGNYGGSSSGSNNSTTQSPTVAPTNNYQQLLDYFKKTNDEAKKSAIDAITARVNAQKDAYNNQMAGLGDQYQALRNQSEVERYKTRSALREAQANRGQLDSGYGRQEQLLMDTQYGNAINSINLQEQAARNEIKNLIQQTEAEGEADKTEVNNNYASALQQYIAQLQKDSQQ